MQVSIPLALHLKCQVTYNFMSNTSWKPGEMYVQTRSIRDFAFIDSHSERFSATLQFGKILRALYEHPDWSQIYNFCSKRYSKCEALSMRSARVLKPTKDGLGFSFNTNKTVTANFNTDPSSIGLPQDFITQIAEA
ncbi:hypothetical protein L873DRAFT_1723552, partial [Choiromyces venosus 120613-1]